MCVATQWAILGNGKLEGAVNTVAGTEFARPWRRGSGLWRALDDHRDSGTLRVAAQRAFVGNGNLEGAVKTFAGTEFGVPRRVSSRLWLALDDHRDSRTLRVAAQRACLRSRNLEGAVKTFAGTELGCLRRGGLHGLAPDKDGDRRKQKENSIFHCQTPPTCKRSKIKPPKGQTGTERDLYYIRDSK